MTNQTKIPLTSNLNLLKQEIFNDLNCCKIGIIESFNAETQTAEINIVFKKMINGKIREYPKLLDCPVITFSSDAGGLNIPILKGDNCIVIFSDNDIDNWFQNGQSALINSLRTHDVSDAIAIVGIKNLNNKITNYDNNSTTLFKNDTIIKLNEKITIQNSSKNLKTLINTLIDTIKNLVTIGSATTQSLDPTTKALLDNIKNEINELLN